MCGCVFVYLSLSLSVCVCVFVCVCVLGWVAGMEKGRGQHTGLGDGAPKRGQAGAAMKGRAFV